MRDPKDEALQRAQEIYQRLMREMRTDQERTLGRAPAQQGSPVRSGDPTFRDSA